MKNSMIAPNSVKRAILRIKTIHVVPQHFRQIPWRKPLEVFISRQMGINLILDPKYTHHLVHPRMHDILDRVATSS
jgi:hypothetical protein